jgi:hypothetical protein
MIQATTAEKHTNTLVPPHTPHVVAWRYTGWLSRKLQENRKYGTVKKYGNGSFESNFPFANKLRDDYIWGMLIII